MTLPPVVFVGLSIGILMGFFMGFSMLEKPLAASLFFACALFIAGVTSE